MKVATKLERSSAELSARLDACKTELDTAIENADLDLMKKLRTELRELPEQIAIKELAECKTRIGQINDEIAEAEDSVKLLMALRIDTREKYQAEMKKLEPLLAEFNRHGENISFAQNHIELLKIERRQRNTRIFSLSETLRSATNE